METPAEKILLNSYTIVEIAGNRYFHLLFIPVPELVDVHVHIVGHERTRLLMGYYDKEKSRLRTSGV